MAETNLPFPFDIKELEPEENKKLLKAYKTSKPDHTFDLISIGPKRYKQLRPYCKDAANIYNMPVRSSDMFVISHQRSGTTMSQEIVWLLTNDFDYAGAKANPLHQRFPFLEFFAYFDKQWEEEFLQSTDDKQKALGLIENIARPITGRLLTSPSPRYIKSHIPLSLLPPSLLDTAKIVYVARDPRDVAVSSYHLNRLYKVLNFPGTFKEFWELYIQDLVNRTPIFEHMKEAWQVRHHKNMLFLFYEELVKDLPNSIRRIADFLGKEVSEDQMTKLCDHHSIEKFSKNKSVNYQSLRELGLLSSEEQFIRKGKSGGWRDYFDEVMTQQAEEWIAANLRDTDLHFPHF